MDALRRWRAVKVLWRLLEGAGTARPRPLKIFANLHFGLNLCEVCHTMAGRDVACRALKRWSSSRWSSSRLGRCIDQEACSDRSDDAQLPIVGDIDLADLFADIIHQGMMTVSATK